MDEMEEQAFVSLAESRRINRTDLPDELARFYSNYEGNGLGTEANLQIARLNEVKKVRWTDLYPTVPEGWEEFSGFLIGNSSYGDYVIYVISAPGIKVGAVLAIGKTELYGPAGDNENGPENTLVLAESFDLWVRRLCKLGCAAHGMFLYLDIPGWMNDLIKSEISALNPHSRYWATI